MDLAMVWRLCMTLFEGRLRYILLTRPGVFVKCRLETGPGASLALGLVQSGDSGWCGLETGQLSSEDWAQCGLDIVPGVVWRLYQCGLVLSGDWRIGLFRYGDWEIAV
ncbi:hypothetical protein chiPu_0027349 [Chiloscyllium punctatum]|uniref:Uncharacterized protein n=1 Tax=Chiloscyllium punctatum TaxID=137246 RepID=A0A401TL75_CHIPU|nr:hypothetical protein [Chiloscyllium punctatum]